MALRKKPDDGPRINYDSHYHDPIHDSSQTQDFKPTPKDKKFRFERKYNSLNQDMLIEKFSQYLTLTNTDTHLIPEIQDGMCNALSYLFESVNSEHYQKCLKKIHEWQGNLIDDCGEEQRAFFDSIRHFVKTYQVGLNSENIQYVGDDLFRYVSESSLSSLIISNANHAVCLKKNGTEYTVYDPNYPNGLQNV